MMLPAVHRLRFDPDARLRWLGTGIWLAISLTLLVSTAIWASRGSPWQTLELRLGPLSLAAIVLTGAVYGSVGASVVRHVPRNPIGWLFLAVALGMAVLLPVNLVLESTVHAFRPVPSAQLWMAWAFSSVQLPFSGSRHHRGGPPLPAWTTRVAPFGHDHEAGHRRRDPARDERDVSAGRAALVSHATQPSGCTGRTEEPAGDRLPRRPGSPGRRARRGGHVPRVALPPGGSARAPTPGLGAGRQRRDGWCGDGALRCSLQRVHSGRRGRPPAPGRGHRCCRAAPEHGPFQGHDRGAGAADRRPHVPLHRPAGLDRDVRADR